MNENNNSNKAAMPPLLTVSPAPHLRSRDSVKNIMLDVIIALAPAFVWGVFMSGVRALLICAVSILSCVIFEAVSQRLMGRAVTVSDFSAVVTGLLLTMCLPVTVPLWMPIVGAFFAIVIVKQLFGGIGKNIVNPALAARALLSTWSGETTLFAAPGSPVSSLAFSLNRADVVAGATPLAELSAGDLPSATMADMLLGNIGGSIGEVSSLLLIFGGIYLLIRRVITWHVPVAFLGSVAALTYFFPQVSNAAYFTVYELTAGGLILGAIFMATDYSTSPITARGRLLYGVGCGGLTVLLRYFGAHAEGVAYAILIMNLLVWYIDMACKPRAFGAVKEAKASVQED